MRPVPRSLFFSLLLGAGESLVVQQSITSSILTPIRSSTVLSMSSTATSVPSWSEIVEQVGRTKVGEALNQETALRDQGKGSAYVRNTLRLFGSSYEKDQPPPITLFRDHAGWCPYCQKVMLLIEEKEVPVNIELVPMRSYGDKPPEFMRKVPNGLLPAIQVNGHIITESSVIMDLLDEWHPPEEGYKPMVPPERAEQERYRKLARLERELFSWWCTLLFRPEMGGAVGGGGMLSKLLGGAGGDSNSSMSGSMQGFLECLQTVNQELKRTPGPWFFDMGYPTSIDFLFVSHVERMLASCAYWKGLNLRDSKWKLDGLNAWLEAFEKREHYLAFKSDYYTHVKDIPPQYGPGYEGGFEKDRKSFFASITGRDGSWSLPLSFDDPLQPLYKGLPLPLCVLAAAGIAADGNDTYESADPTQMAMACRIMAAWKLAGNGDKVSSFAARGGPDGAKNPRKSFGAELADPYANPDESVAPYVDEAMRVVCLALLSTDQTGLPGENMSQMLKNSIPSNQANGVVSSLVYLRDRIGVPRDLPLASARYLRAYLNWGITSLGS